MADKLYVDIDKAVGMGYLSDWYQASIDDTKPPIWTDEHIYELVNDFLIIPNDTPTADVVEVKHGEWETVVVYNDTCIATCSSCRQPIVERGCNATAFKLENEFCRKCGAKMDGGKM